MAPVVLTKQEFRLTGFQAECLGHFVLAVRTWDHELRGRRIPDLDRSTIAVSIVMGPAQSRERREATAGSDRDLNFPHLVGLGRATAVI
jgi:hypothetical protein